MPIRPLLCEIGETTVPIDQNINLIEFGRCAFNRSIFSWMFSSVANPRGSVEEWQSGIKASINRHLIHSLYF